MKAGEIWLENSTNKKVIIKFLTSDDDLLGDSVIFLYLNETGQEFFEIIDDGEDGQIEVYETKLRKEFIKQFTKIY